MVSKKSRSEVRVNKHRKLRNRFSGTAERPRLAVFRSNNHMYAQIIDDTVGNTLVSASTLQKDVKAELEKTNNVEAAAYLGTVIAKKAIDTPVSLTLEYSVAGKSYAASISTFAKDNAFKEGTHQKYNIAVNGKEIQITGGEIGSWNDGGEMGDINLDVKTGDEENK